MEANDTEKQWKQKTFPPKLVQLDAENGGEPKCCGFRGGGGFEIIKSPSASKLSQLDPGSLEVAQFTIQRVTYSFTVHYHPKKVTKLRNC